MQFEKVRLGVGPIPLNIAVLVDRILDDLPLRAVGNGEGTTLIISGDKDKVRIKPTQGSTVTYYELESVVPGHYEVIVNTAYITIRAKASHCHPANPTLNQEKPLTLELYCR